MIHFIYLSIIFIMYMMIKQKHEKIVEYYNTADELLKIVDRQREEVKTTLCNIKNLTASLEKIEENEGVKKVMQDIINIYNNQIIFFEIAEMQSGINNNKQGVK